MAANGKMRTGKIGCKQGGDSLKQSERIYRIDDAKIQQLMMS